MLSIPQLRKRKRGETYISRSISAQLLLRWRQRQQSLLHHILSPNLFGVSHIKLLPYNPPLHISSLPFWALQPSVSQETYSTSSISEKIHELQEITKLGWPLFSRGPHTKLNNESPPLAFLVILGHALLSSLTDSGSPQVTLHYLH